MNFLPLILQILGGAAGGNVLGSVVKDSNLGTAGNTVAGGIGGLLMSVLGPMLGMGTAAAGGVDIGTILANLVGGGVAGGIVQLVVGLIKNRMA